MNTPELAKLLARIAVLDNRQVDEVTMQAWADVIPETVRYDDAVASVNAHFANSTDYLLPAHIVAGSRKAAMLRSEREEVHARAFIKTLEKLYGEELDWVYYSHGLAIETLRLNETSGLDTACTYLEEFTSKHWGRELTRREVTA